LPPGSRHSDKGVARIWYDDQIQSDLLKGETVAVIGYGIQGAAQASNMRDSGVRVVVGLRKGGKSWNQATNEGHMVMEVPDAADKADIVHILIPDMEQAKVYREDIAPHIEKGKAISFSHAAAIHWKWIVPPTGADVIMLAPKAPGQRLRELYLQNFGVPALVAVHNDASGKALNRILGIAKATGCSRAGVVETTFKEEVETDWFGEQVDLCGGVDRMMRNAFETLVEAGYQPEIAYFECLHELKLIVDLVNKYGIAGMYRRVSETARYGGLTRGGRVMNANVKKEMRKALDEIQNGKFADEWVRTYEKEGPRAFQKYLDELEGQQVEQVGKKLRSMMWPKDQTS
jgi:ketol-acid reductoisomerase